MGSVRREASFRGGCLPGRWVCIEQTSGWGVVVWFKKKKKKSSDGAFRTRLMSPLMTIPRTRQALDDNSPLFWRPFLSCNTLEWLVRESKQKIVIEIVSPNVKFYRDWKQSLQVHWARLASFINELAEGLKADGQLAVVLHSPALLIGLAACASSSWISSHLLIPSSSLLTQT